MRLYYEVGRTPSAAGGRRSEEFIARNKEHGRVKEIGEKDHADYITRWAELRALPVAEEARSLLRGIRSMAGKKR